MATPVPALERAIGILSLMAARPHEPVRAAAVADALGISKATCFSLLMALTDAGLLTRDEARKTYALGPVLVTLGSAARTRYEGFVEAGEEIRRLAAELGVECLVAAAVGDEIVVTDRSAPLGMWQVLPAGFRTPMVPPAGLVYRSWAPAEEFDAWLDRHAVDDDATRQQVRQAAAIVRQRGYAGGLEHNEAQVLEVVGRMSDPDDGADRTTVALRLVELLRHGTSFLTAPVFAADGSVPMALTIYRPPEALSGVLAEQAAEQLVAAADRVTVAIGGTPPPREAPPARRARTRARARATPRDGRSGREPAAPGATRAGSARRTSTR